MLRQNLERPRESARAALPRVHLPVIIRTRRVAGITLAYSGKEITVEHPVATNPSDVPRCLADRGRPRPPAAVGAVGAVGVHPESAIPPPGSRQ